MKLEIADEDAFVEGRSPEKARELIGKAEKAGIDLGLIRTTPSGYIVPKELADSDNETVDQNLVEVGNGLPKTGWVDGIDDAQVAATVGSELLEAVQPVADAGAVEGAILNQPEPTDAKTVGPAEGNGSSTVDDSAILTQHAGDPEKAGIGTFDPADHNVEEVKIYLDDANDAERERVLAAEKDGKNRKALAGEKKESK